jgi:hypothetical protein
MTGGLLARAFAYFGLIGTGFMMIQVPLLQRFSVYLGHPIYSYAVILFSMILFTGVGSSLSERLRPEGRWWRVVPPAIAATVVLLVLAMQPVIEATVRAPTPLRCLIVVALTAPLSLMLGLCFPLGVRLVGRLDPAANAWMWGVNGAASVLASIVAVAVSIWFGIHANLAVAALLYLLLAVPAGGLASAGRRAGPLVP